MNDVIVVYNALMKFIVPLSLLAGSWLGGSCQKVPYSEVRVKHWIQIDKLRSTECLPQSVEFATYLQLNFKVLDKILVLQNISKYM